MPTISGVVVLSLSVRQSGKVPSSKQGHCSVYEGCERNELLIIVLSTSTGTLPHNPVSAAVQGPVYTSAAVEARTHPLHFMPLSFT